MSETARIRWDAVDGTVVSWFGYVGSVMEPLFHILHPVTDKSSRSRYDEWVLCATLVGADVARYAESREPEDAVTELKAEAERWLEEFVTSLGAVFPDEAFEFDYDDLDLEVAYAPGAYVRYQHPDAGWPGEQDEARSLLTHGRLYRVAWNDIGQSSTRIGLVGVTGTGFNSVLFEPVPGEDVTDAEAAEVAARTILSAPGTEG